MRRRALAARTATEAAGDGQSLARLLTIAHAVDRLVQDGTLPSYQEAARRLGISHVRMSEICALTGLAPGVHDAILANRLDANERALRAVCGGLPGKVAFNIDWPPPDRMDIALTAIRQARNNLSISQ
jgi:hypothetical protein